MASNKKSASVLKYGVLVAAIIIVVRIVLELLGVPGSINSVFGVAWLYLILPVLFAFYIVAEGESRPLRALFNNVLLFAVYTRLMVMITYMLAYSFKWEAPRFSLPGGGNVGNDVNALNGFLLIPLRNALIWIIMAVILGMIIGGVTIWLRKMSARPASS